MFIKIYYDPYSPPSICSKSGGKLLLAIMVLIVVKSLILNYEDNNRISKISNNLINPS